MKKIKLILALTIICFLAACSGKKLEEKGFSVNPSSENNENNNADGISKDSLSFETKPSNVLLTGIPQHRLTTIYKVNYDKKDETSFIGYNNYHFNYSELEETEGNQWNSNFMPGIEAVYGYNFVNISHYDIVTNKQNNFFERPVLIKTLYYPSLSKDTLNSEPVKRNYYMVSVYDEDTNKDGFINVNDLRRLYLFDINGVKQKALVPVNYSVVKSEYDAANDFMYVFAQLDENKNGQINAGEQTHIFWINLKDPTKSGREY